jgi:hypothetical protein
MALKENMWSGLPRAKRPETRIRRARVTVERVTEQQRLKRRLEPSLAKEHGTAKR